MVTDWCILELVMKLYRPNHSVCIGYRLIVLEWAWCATLARHMVLYECFECSAGCICITLACMHTLSRTSLNGSTGLAVVSSSVHPALLYLSTQVVAPECDLFAILPLHWLNYIAVEGVGCWITNEKVSAFRPIGGASPPSAFDAATESHNCAGHRGRFPSSGGEHPDFGGSGGSPTGNLNALCLHAGAQETPVLPRIEERARGIMGPCGMQAP